MPYVKQWPTREFTSPPTSSARNNSVPSSLSFNSTLLDLRNMMLAQASAPFLISCQILGLGQVRMAATVTVMKNSEGTVTHIRKGNEMHMPSIHTMITGAL